MQFPIRQPWFRPLVLFVSVLSVSLLFALAGLVSPLVAPGPFVWRIVLFVAVAWGLAFGLGHLLSFILQKLFPARFVNR